MRNLLRDFSIKKFLVGVRCVLKYFNSNNNDNNANPKRLVNEESVGDSEVYSWCLLWHVYIDSLIQTCSSLYDRKFLRLVCN